MSLVSRSRAITALSLLVVLAICVALLISLKGAAHAASPSLTLNIPVGPPTTLVKASGKGFGASETVGLTFDGTAAATATTNANGVFTGKVTVPPSAQPGNHTIVALGQTSGSTAQATFLVQTDWSMFGFNLLHNRFNSYENVVTAANVSTLITDWTASTTGTVESSPTIASGIAYVGSSDKSLYAFNATTGALVWSAPTLGAITSSPTVNNGTVYVGSTDGKLYTFNATTGAAGWTYTTGGAINSSPTVGIGNVYIGSNDHKLYAINATTGVLAWSSRTIVGPVLSSPALDHGVVFVVGQFHRVYAFDAFTGATRWSTPGNFNNVSLAAYNGVVYVGSLTTFSALNETTGALVWSATIGINASAAVANGIVYVGSLNHSVYAFNATTGAQLWTAPTGGAIKSSVAVADGVIYVGSDDMKLYAFHLPGKTP